MTFSSQLISYLWYYIFKRRVCLEQETTYVRSRFATRSLFRSPFAQPPPPPLQKAILCSFCCRHHWRLHPRVQNVVSLFKAFRSWGTRRTTLSERRLAAYKKRQRPFFIAYLGGGGVGKIECPIFFSAPQPPPPPLFISLRHRGKVNLLLRTIFLFTEKSKKSLGAPEPFLLVQIVGLMINGIKLNSVWTVVVGQSKTVV